MATAAAREKTKQVEKFMNGLVFDAKPEEISLGAFKLFEIIQKVIRNTDERYAKREKHGMGMNVYDNRIAQFRNINLTHPFMPFDSLRVGNCL